MENHNECEAVETGRNRTGYHPAFDGGEHYGTTMYIAESPHEADTIRTGSDEGDRSAPISLGSELRAQELKNQWTQIKADMQNILDNELQGLNELLREDHVPHIIVPTDQAERYFD